MQVRFGLKCSLKTLKDQIMKMRKQNHPEATIECGCWRCLQRSAEGTRWGANSLVAVTGQAAFQLPKGRTTLGLGEDAQPGLGCWLWQTLPGLQAVSHPKRERARLAQPPSFPLPLSTFTNTTERDATCVPARCGPGWRNLPCGDVILHGFGASICFFSCRDLHASQLFLKLCFGAYSWVLFSWKTVNIFLLLYDLSYRNTRADLVVVIESFRIQGKDLVRQGMRIQNETSHKTNALFAAIILKSSCANLVWEFIKQTLRKHFTN